MSAANRAYQFLTVYSLAFVHRLMQKPDWLRIMRAVVMAGVVISPAMNFARLLTGGG